MADFSITGEVRLNSDPAEKSTSKWTVAAGQMIADFAKQASSKLAEVVKSGVDYNATMESYLTNFKVMLGSEEAAATKLSEIRKMAASTPFSLDDLTSGTQTLLQFGIAADDTTGVLQRLGDISLGNAEKLQTLTRAYGKMSSAQKVTLENVNMMIDAGFNPLNQICDATGESMSDLYKRISDGKVSFSELEAAVEAATSQGGQFYNGMLEASQTFSGRMSTLTDNTKALLGALSDSFYSSLSDLLPVANDVVLELTDAFAEGGVPAMLDTAAELLDNFADGLIQKIPDAVSAVSDLLTELLNYLADHQDDIFDSGVQLLENLIIGITDSLPNLITSAANLIARFAAALISHLPDLLQCGASLLQAIVNGILLGIANLGEAAIACVAKIVGVWDGSYTEWGNIGTNIVLGIKNGIIGAWDGLVSGVKSKVAGMVDSVKGLLGIHSPSKVFDEIGMNICKGLAQGLTTNGELAKDAAAQVVASVTNTATTLADGIETVTQSVTETLKDGTTQQKQTITSTGIEIIDGVERTVKTVTTIAADGTKTVSKTIEDAGPQFSSAAELLTHQFTEKLNSSWEQINKSIQSDVVGSIQTLFKAIKDGDLESIATWSAAYFWNACTQEQRTQIQTFAMDALGKLSGSLSGVFKDVAGLAASFVGQFVPAATAATGAQTGLNIAMDANPIMLVISLIGMLVGALGSFISTNKNASSSVKSIWGGIGDFMSYIFEGLLRVYGAYLQGFVNIINGLIKVYNAVAWLWDGKIDPVSNIAFDYADKIRKDREERKAAEKAEAEKAKAQAQLDAQYAKQSGAAEKKQLDAKYNKKLAELEKAKLTKDDHGMLEAEKKVLAAGYEQDLADLEKKVLDARYKLASAQLEKKTTTSAARLAELEKQINEAQNVIQMSDLEKQLLGVEYQKSLAELIAKYQPKKDSTSSGSSSSGSSPSNSDELANKISELEKSYNQKLQELKNTYTNKGEAQSAEYERRLADLKADYEKQLAALKKQLTALKRQLTEKDNSSNSLSTKLNELEKSYNQRLQELKNNSTVKDVEYERKLAALKADYEKQLAELKRQYSSSSGSSGTVPTPDTNHDKVIEDNTAALVEANKKLAEMVRQANALVLSDNMKVSNRVAASGTAQVAAAAGNYHREGDTTVNQYIYSKAQTAADLARETRWEADHAKAKKR